MKKTKKTARENEEDLKPEYDFDYTKARPNPYAARLKGRAVVARFGGTRSSDLRDRQATSKDPAPVPRLLPPAPTLPGEELPTRRNAPVRLESSRRDSLLCTLQTRSRPAEGPFR